LAPLNDRSPIPAALVGRRNVGVSSILVFAWSAFSAQSFIRARAINSASLHQTPVRRMSALGQKQTFSSSKAMSAIPPKADIGTWPVRPAHWLRQLGDVHRDPPCLGRHKL